jgi:hypothetical protein
MKTRQGLGKTYNARQHFCYIYDRFELLNLKKKKLFCAFLDVGKVFDTVWRDGLWYKLYMCNNKGKMYHVIYTCIIIYKKELFIKIMFKISSHA